MLSHSLRRGLLSRVPRRHFSVSRSNQLTELLMPALSPTMMEGAISDWKLKEGDAFSAGDVLVGIETDKAAIDVEAMDDGIMGKIIMPNGSTGVAVGKLIAILAEEGDDLSKIEIPVAVATPTPVSPPAPSPPKPSPSPPAAIASSPPPQQAAAPTPAAAATPAPPKSHHITHSSPLLPSVLRLLSLNNITDLSAITPTGRGGLLITKGDVLAFLGKIENARGGEKVAKKVEPVFAAQSTKSVPVESSLDGPAIRRMIAFALSAPRPKVAALKAASAVDFDSILDDYLPASQRSKPKKSVVDAVGPTKKGDSLDEFLGM